MLVQNMFTSSHISFSQVRLSVDQLAACICQDQHVRSFRIDLYRTMLALDKSKTGTENLFSGVWYGGEEAGLSKLHTACCGIRLVLMSAMKLSEHRG